MPLTPFDAAPGSDPASRTLATAALVLDITTAAAGERELDAILGAALDRLRGVVAFTGGSIALVDGDDLVIRAAIGPFEAEALGQRVARGPSQSWRVVETLESVRIDDLHGAGSEGRRGRGRDGRALVARGPDRAARARDRPSRGRFDRQ